MKEPVEFFDKDFLDDKIEIGDKVIFEAPGYRSFVVGTVITKAPKSCQIEYINDWNYDGVKEVVRQGYGQVIKYPIKEGKWIFKKYAGQEYYTCSCCDKGFPLPPTWNASDVKKHLKYCSSCGVKMSRGDKQ